MIGVEAPSPGTLRFHRMFSVWLHVSGGLAAGAAPVPSGPRHCGQFSNDCELAEDAFNAIAITTKAEAKWQTFTVCISETSENPSHRTTNASVATIEGIHHQCTKKPDRKGLQRLARSTELSWINAGASTVFLEMGRFLKRLEIRTGSREKRQSLRCNEPTCSVLLMRSPTLRRV